ncbi:uncharacterized protein LOC117118206 [Anneissia japonica]|uniref:uncharacterized protein LOC117118206 n=1 Tax=Anneissia japonica TaxID=1529436 RepID=UPI0014257E15|nr:uncharacterized protein LOC117118206 [Anneissia japonica]
MTMNKPVNSIADDLSGLRTDYHELMEQLQRKQRTLRSKFPQNVTTTSPKRSRRSDKICMENPGAKRMKIVENEKTFASRSKQNIPLQTQKTSTPYKFSKHSRTTARTNMSSSHIQVSTSLKRKHAGGSFFSNLTASENDKFIIDDANRRSKKPYPTPLRVHNTHKMSFTQQKQQQTSTPKSIMKKKTTHVNTSASTSASLHKSEKENIVGLRRSTRLSRSPHFHSDALRSDYHNEMRKRRRLSDDVLNNSYKQQLDHTGNNRPKHFQATDVTPRPKSILMQSRKSKRTPNRVNFCLHDTTLDQSHLDRSGRVQPLLGYDWIAGLLDAEDTISERSDAFFDELKDFRRVNKEDCVYRQTDER